MKAIIYAGIGLFAIASVYGVADYYSSQKKGTLDKLYKEEEVAVEAPKNEIPTTVIPVNKVSNEVNSNRTVAATTKVAKRTRPIRKKIRFEDFSRGRIDVPMAVPVTTPVEVKKEEPAQKEDPVMEKVIAAGKEIITPQPERKLSFELFSRAPLRPVKKVVKN
jgi:hypothetical protein